MVYFSLLPEFHHSAGKVFSVWEAVVGIAAVCVPRIATSLPWQGLKIKEGKKKKRTSHSDHFLLGPLSHLRAPFSLADKQPSPRYSFGTLRFHAFFKGLNDSCPNAFINMLCKALIMWERK